MISLQDAMDFGKQVVQDGHESPLTVFVGNTVFPIMTDGDDWRAPVVELIQELVQREEANEYIVLNEGWAINTEQANEFLKQKIIKEMPKVESEKQFNSVLAELLTVASARPSEHPAREELLIVNKFSKTGKTSCLISRIKRSGKNGESVSFEDDKMEENEQVYSRFNIWSN